MLENEQLPYILKIDNEKYLMESYKVVIKHHMSVQLLQKKLIESMYETISDFKNDLNLMWHNLEIFYGNDSEIVKIANIIKNDIKVAWESSVEET